MSGLHFGNFKTGCLDPAVAQFDWQVRFLPLTHRLSPNTWKLATEFDLLKQPGIYVLEKMSTIILMNAEFNMNNKWIGK